VTHTIGVHGHPYFIDVSRDGKRAYVANSGSANVSVLDLDQHKVIATVAVGAKPGLARVSPDGKIVVVTNRGDDSVSLIDAGTLAVRATVKVCRSPEQIAILPYAPPKAFVSCSASNQVAAIDLEKGALLTLLDVGKTPISLTLKPDGGQLFVQNYEAQSISDISTATNEVNGTYLIGRNPVSGVVTDDNSLLYVANFGSDSIAVYDINNGRVTASVPVGAKPDAMALTPNQSYLLVCDTAAGEVAVVRTRIASGGTVPPVLLTMIPVGREPRQIAVKNFMLRKPPQ
jgi:YVTN family beta-propeller protein